MQWIWFQDYRYYRNVFCNPDCALITRIHRWKLWWEKTLVNCAFSKINFGGFITSLYTYFICYKQLAGKTLLVSQRITKLQKFPQQKFISIRYLQCQLKFEDNYKLQCAILKKNYILKECMCTHSYYISTYTVVNI